MLILPFEQAGMLVLPFEQAGMLILPILPKEKRGCQKAAKNANVLPIQLPTPNSVKRLPVKLLQARIARANDNKKSVTRTETRKTRIPLPKRDGSEEVTTF